MLSGVCIVAYHALGTLSLRSCNPVARIMTVPAFVPARIGGTNDAQAILNGPEDSATRYFRGQSEEQLTQRFLPLVKQATDQAGVTAAYKALIGQAGGLLGGFMNMDGLDVDQYVTGKAMDGLFKYIAIQEKQIRENPTARTTDLLKKVFGS